MDDAIYTHLQLREIFHLEFLRWLGRKIKQENYVLKGGVNLRFFFNNFRYSEDMDLDAGRIQMHALKDAAMGILEARSFQESLKPFGIEKIVPPDIGKAKQTETTQRFKVHLLTSAGEDLFTKVEFSRRGANGSLAIEPVSDTVLRAYKLSPLLCPHYVASSAVFQKVKALAMRSAVQARDVFDLYVLTPQTNLSSRSSKVFTLKMTQSLLERARENALEISFEQFRDTVVSYLAPEDRSVYDKAAAWDEIKLRVSDFLERAGKSNA